MHSFSSHFILNRISKNVEIGQATYSTERVGQRGQRVAAPRQPDPPPATMAEAGSTALHVTRQGTLVAASSSLRVRIVAAGGATLHEGLLPGTAEACAIQLNDTGTRLGPRRAPSPATSATTS